MAELQAFSSNGVEIAYLDTGHHGPVTGSSTTPTGRLDSEAHAIPVLLVHGFASNHAVNWVSTGWVDLLTRAGYRVIAVDNRGHGQSAKLYGIEDYSAPIMAEDARRLLDHLEIAKAHVIGYSMGARIAAFLAMAHPQRVASVTFAGLGINMVRGMGEGGDAIAEALEAPTLEAVASVQGRLFRAFAEQTNSDLKALAACMRSARVAITVDRLALIACPVLIVVGTADDVAGSPAELAQLIPGARWIAPVGRDHMKAVGDRAFKTATLDFLASGG